MLPSLSFDDETSNPGSAAFPERTWLVSLCNKRVDGVSLSATDARKRGNVTTHPSDGGNQESLEAGITSDPYQGPEDRRGVLPWDLVLKSNCALILCKTVVCKLCLSLRDSTLRAAFAFILRRTTCLGGPSKSICLVPPAQHRLVNDLLLEIARVPPYKL